jgi:type I restriction enzyme S subunit
MSVKCLLARYERIADAPDAIARLRRFILDLAVRGKLVPQRSEDEPSSELLKRITAEKGRLVKMGEVKKDKPLPDILPEEAPYDLPQGWEWVRIRRVTSDRGQIVPDRDFTYIDVTAINKDVGRIDGARVTSASDAPSRARKIVRKGDVLYSCVRPYLLNIAIVESDMSPPPIASTAFAVNYGFGLVEPRYQWIVLRSPFMVTCVEEKMRGQAYPAINDSDFALLPFPLPPLAEQHRIVAKVDELMALCDRLEAARAAREETRDRLAAASLARLNAHTSNPTTFADDARFALKVLPALAKRADQIKQFRQTILNLAVRGKLLRQDPSDGSAVEFDAAISDDLELPFEIPKSWRWARLRALGKIKCGGTPSKARDDFWSGHIPWVSPKDMKIDYLAQAQLNISEAAIEGSAASLIKAGSVLFVVRGMILAHSFPVAVTRVPLAINQDIKALVPKKPEMAEFLLRALKGLKPEMLKRVQRSSHGTCRLEEREYGDFLVPIPPLAEQRRIVAKVDELMALCDRLEASLTASEDNRRRLLDALLAEALAPAENVTREPKRVAAHG